MGAVIPFENALRRSRIETAAFECKQGILRLDHKRTRDSDLLDRIVETICAIANLGPASTGAVFIGVADSPSDKKRIEEIDKVQTATVGARFCVGVDREAAVMGIGADQYVRNIVSHISKSKLSEPLKTAVCSSIDAVVYRGLSVVCVWIPSQKVPSEVSDQLFIRMGSETRRVDGLKQTKAVMALFGGQCPLANRTYSEARSRVGRVGIGRALMAPSTTAALRLYVEHLHPDPRPDARMFLFVPHDFAHAYVTECLRLWCSQGFGVNELASKLGVSGGTISNVVNGYQAPGPRVLDGFTEALSDPSLPAPPAPPREREDGRPSSPRRAQPSSPTTCTSRVSSARSSSS